MRWISLGLLATLLTCSASPAGLFENFFCFRPATTSGGCTTDSCAPEGCTTGCCPPRFTHQRRLSNIPVPCKPNYCSTDGCTEGDSCTAEGCNKRCCNPACTDSTCHSRVRCCEIAELIHESMTACYAKQRYNAVHHLSDYFDCCCHPEIMHALVYALNDSHEKVRAKAADEIGDQIRRNRCVCSPSVITALRASVRDCDPEVRRQAQEALNWAAIRGAMPCRVIGQTCPPQQIQQEAESEEKQPAEVPPPTDALPEKSAPANPEQAEKREETAELPTATASLIGSVSDASEPVSEAKPLLIGTGPKDTVPPVDGSDDAPRIPRPNLADLLIDSPAKK